MLLIRNRYNENGDIIQTETYEPMRISALEEFLAEIYAGKTEKQYKMEISTNYLSSWNGWNTETGMV